MAVSNVVEIERQEKLFEAARNGNTQDVLQLLNEGVDVNVHEYKILYKQKQRVDFSDGKILATPLIAAAENGHVECVKFLLDHGAHVDARDIYAPWLTALHKASENGHHLCVKELLEAGADPDLAVTLSVEDSKYYISHLYFNGTTALHLSSHFNNVACVTELCQYGADYNAVDSRGRTSLYVAAERKNVEALLAHFENSFGLSRPLLSLPSLETGETPLHFCMRNCSQMEQCAVELLELGADVNHIAFDGNTPLLELLFHNNSVYQTFPHALRMLNALVMKADKVDFNLPNNKGYTPLHYVAFHDSVAGMKCRKDLAAFMLAYGANPHIRDRSGCTLFDYYLKLKEPQPVNDFIILKALAKCMVHLPYFAKPEEYPYVQDVRYFNPLNPHAELFQWIHQKEKHMKMINYEWYLSLTSSPRSLRHYSRCAIRSALGPSRIRCVHDLVLPLCLQDYLLLVGDEFL